MCHRIDVALSTVQGVLVDKIEVKKGFIQGHTISPVNCGRGAFMGQAEIVSKAMGKAEPAIQICPFSYA